ncbi:alpha/beta hydrolase [Alicyclobacillus sp.]|uniref:alpha/beta hydrolase n=1 Tax=Alicyclobacillus sp. TaxID=61169 RepID=UPI0025BC2E32|nr:alpha/beta hydrolase [Alicyclobacillus sp.]MCL6516465.1 alpha/beta hydrolase [Alicyclobacillus sp.]
MTLDPRVERLLAAIDPSAPSPGPGQDPVALRAFRRQSLEALQLPVRPVGAVEDRSLPGPGGPLPVRVYRPAAHTRGAMPTGGATPVGKDGESDLAPSLLVYFHGGGWVLGDLDTVDDTCRALCEACRRVVVSVDYRLAPEHRFPAAVDDALRAVRWVADHAEALGASPEGLVVAGDSAGGNLATVVALRARDEGGPAIAGQVLVYPITDHNFDTPSYREHATGYSLTRAGMMWFFAQYLPRAEDADHPWVSPLRARDLSGLPPALVITAEHDPLRDEGERYAQRLEAAGVPVRLVRFDGMVHGFFGNAAWDLPQRMKAIRLVAEFLDDLRWA